MTLVKTLYISPSDEPITCNLKNTKNTHSSYFAHYAGRDYSQGNLAQLLKDSPSLRQNSKNWLALAEIINFLFTGLDFIVIVAPEEYKQYYKEKFEKESRFLQNNAEADPSYYLSSLCARGLFDLQELSLPSCNDKFFIFFAKDRIADVPHRVKYTFETGAISYELLPHLPDPEYFGQNC